MMKQGEAVYQAIVNVCGDSDGAYTPTKEQRATVAQVLFAGFRSGKIVLSQDYDDKELTKYIPGLISNWLRKDPRLNDGVKYEPKNPGSRSGSTDAQVKAMRVLLSMKTDVVERAEIQSIIDKRLAEIKPTKAELTEEQIETLKALGLEHLI
jgi:hypothetical protein